MKKIVILAIATVLVLSTGVALAGGPAEKATGYVRLNGWAEGWYAQFNAHEEMDSRPAKGSMRVWSVISGRELHFDVWYVLSEGDYAWFAAKCTWYNGIGSNKVGQWLYVKVYDGGTPGCNGDEIGWDWTTSETVAAAFVSGQGHPPFPYWTNVVEGNLVVHTYE